IYSLGVILYQMIAGKPPFDASTVMDILRAHITDPPPPFSATAPDLRVPTELESLIFWMLEKAPEDRPQSVDELRGRFPGILAIAAPKLPAPRSSSRLISTLPPDDPWSTAPPGTPVFPDTTGPARIDGGDAKQKKPPSREVPIEDIRIEDAPD